jgi:antitoxin YefM
VLNDTTYTNLRQNLSSILDRVSDDLDTVVVRRKDGRDVALVPASELDGLMETAHLLRPPKNAQRLLKALGRAKRKGGRAMTIEKLARESGLGSRA